MEHYFVEGVYVSKRRLKKIQKGGGYAPADQEPFGRTFWANSAEEALRQAEEALNGGQWIEPPHVSRLSEEQRMRNLGAPELPGFGVSKTAPKKHRAS